MCSNGGPIAVMTFITEIKGTRGHPACMRIIATGELLVVMSGGKGPSVPKPSASEIALQQAQAESVRQQTAIAKQQLEIAQTQQTELSALQPLLLEDAGIRRIEDDTVEGGFRFERTEPDELVAQQREIQGLQQARSLSALKGELPVTETLQQEIVDQERILRQELYNRLGSGYETSTGGIRALSEFRRMSTALREGERQDQLTTAEALSISRGDQRDRTRSAQFNRQLSATTTTPALSSEFLGVAGRGFGNSARTAYNAAGQLRRNRMDRYNASLAGFNANQDLLGGAMSGAFGLGMAAFLAPTGTFSHPSLKEHMQPISEELLLEWVTNIPVSRWQYKQQPDLAEWHIGGMTTEMPVDVTMGNGYQIDTVSYLGMLTGAIQALVTRVQTLEEELHYANTGASVRESG